MTTLHEAARAFLTLYDIDPPHQGIGEAIERLRDALAADDGRVSVPREPLSVFDAGPWIWTQTGEQFTGAQLDEAAFAKYRDTMLAAAEGK